MLSKTITVTRRRFSWTTFLSAASLLISVCALWFSYSSGVDSTIEKCAYARTRLIDAVVQHLVAWQTNIVNRTEMGEDTSGIVETTRANALTAIEGSKRFMSKSTKVQTFERRVTSHGAAGSRLDSLVSYERFLRSGSLSYYAKGSSKTVLKSTTESIKSLSVGIIELLRKRKCDRSGKF